MANSSASDALQPALAFTVGTLGGECFRATCRSTGAGWYHQGAGRYYCADCAAEINQACKIKGEPPACSQRR